MVNSYKLIEILISLQSLIISTMIPVYIQLPFVDRSNNSFEIPITWQLPAVIMLTVIFRRKVVSSAFSVYVIIGLFLLPVFHEGGSMGYLLTPNFGYLLGIYPLIKIIDKINKKEKVNIRYFLIYGFLAISAMHLTGIFYNFIQIIFYKDFNLFLYNIGKYSIGKIGYHLIIIIPLLLLIKPIKYLKNRK